MDYNTSIKRQFGRIRKQNPSAYRKYLKSQARKRPRLKGWKTIVHVNGKQQQKLQQYRIPCSFKER